ncbi:hypothetical protein U1Q18_006913 [Sarracenia purpurea var. burkii]
MEPSKFIQRRKMKAPWGLSSEASVLALSTSTTVSPKCFEEAYPIYAVAIDPPCAKALNSPPRVRNFADLKCDWESNYLIFDRCLSTLHDSFFENKSLLDDDCTRNPCSATPLGIRHNSPRSILGGRIPRLELGQVLCSALLRRPANPYIPSTTSCESKNRTEEKFSDCDFLADAAKPMPRWKQALLPIHMSLQKWAFEERSGEPQSVLGDNCSGTLTPVQRSLLSKIYSVRPLLSKASRPTARAPQSITLASQSVARGLSHFGQKIESGTVNIEDDVESGKHKAENAPAKAPTLRPLFQISQ